MTTTSPAMARKFALAVNEAYAAIVVAHERLEGPRPLDLDHRLGENDEGCTFCTSRAIHDGPPKGATR